MNAVHPTFAPFLASICPAEWPGIRKDPTPEQAEAIDAAMLADKLNDGYNRRNDAQAMALQVKNGGAA